MKITKTHYQVSVPAGRYFLGDPCYTVPNNLWGTLLQSCDFFDQPIGEVNGHKVLAFPTAQGDGLYEDQNGHEYPVDAGLIGLVPEALVDMEKLSKYRGGVGKWLEVSHYILCTGEDGVMEFGNITIDTKWD